MVAKVQWIVLLLFGSWVVAWRRLGDRWGWLGMLNAWVEWIVAALGALALIGALGRRWRMALGASLLSAMGAGYFNPLSRLPWSVGPPRHRNVSSPGRSTTGDEADFILFSANLYKLSRSATHHIELIRKYQPDILCFQELTPDLAIEIVEAVGARYPYRDWHPRPGPYGLGILSRFPLEMGEVWDRPGVEPWVQRVRCWLSDDRPLDLYNVHLVPPTAGSTLSNGMSWGFRAREAQIQMMIGEIEARRVAACIVGDCNFSDSSDAYRLACDALNDAWLRAGHGLRWTWPTRDFPFPSIPWVPRMLRLDYCFHNDLVRARRMQVLAERTGSDHCPLLVELMVGDATPE